MCANNSQNDKNQQPNSENSIKILLINGSPRKNGMTNALLNSMSKSFDKLVHDYYENNNKSSLKIEIELLQLSDYKIEHCTGCDSCLRKPNTCPLSENDDMPKLEQKLKDSSAIIIGSPSYFANVSGLVKDLIDRSRPMKMAKYQLKNKYFSAIAVSGLKDGGNNWVVDSLNHWALIHGMIVVGALGHPVLMNNIPSESLQMINLKEFRKISEPGEIAITLAENLAKRIFELVIN